MVAKTRISIWFFIGTLLLLYGVIITSASIYAAYHPSYGGETVLRNLDFGIWWGILLIIIGLVYFILFRPWKQNPLA
jgi:hypothetical protein